MEHSTRRPGETGAAPPGHRPLRMLVVDDDPDMRRYIRLTLERAWAAGSSMLTVEECGDGAEALALVEQERFDVVVTDVRLPGLDGLALCEALDRSARHDTTAVLIVTGEPSAHERAEAFVRAGARRALLTKPFNAARLVEALGRLLEAP